MTTTTVDQSPSPEVLVQRAYASLRNCILTRKHELGQQAGALALDALLKPAADAARQQAITMKYELLGLDIALDRLDGEWRHRESPEKFVKAVRSMLVSNRDYYQQDAGQYALRVVDSDPAGASYAEGHTNALRSYRAYVAHQYLLDRLEECFADVSKAFATQS
jgi:hypothetical protein